MAITTDPGNHFDPAEFDECIEQHGVPANWRKSRICPCFDPKRGQSSITCPYCTLIPGRLYDAGTEVTVLAPGRERQDKYTDVGSWEQGFVNITFPTLDDAVSVTPGHFDIVELLSGEIVVNNEFLKRGELTPGGASRERLRLNPLRVEFIEAIVASVLVQYAFFTDYTFDAAGVITWINGPPSGTQYSIRYVARPTFIVWAPMSRDEAATKMPYRVHAQRLDFFERRAVE